MVAVFTTARRLRELWLQTCGYLFESHIRTVELFLCQLWNGRRKRTRVLLPIVPKHFRGIFSQSQKYSNGAPATMLSPTMVGILSSYISIQLIRLIAFQCPPLTDNHTQSSLDPFSKHCDARCQCLRFLVHGRE